MNIHRFFSFFCFLFSKALLIELDGRPGESLHQKVTGETHSSLGGWFQVPDLALRNHYFVVPLDYDSPDGSSISIFAREVVGSKFQSLSFLLSSIYVSHFQFASLMYTYGLQMSMLQIYCCNLHNLFLICLK